MMSSKNLSAKGCIRSIAASCLLTALMAAPALARSGDEQAARGFVESVAAMVYACAWPTATYESASFKTFDPVEEGYDAVFRLNGKSAFGGGDLWVDLVFEFRNGELHDVRVKRHNAILVPPFETCKAVAKAIAEAAEGGHSAPLPRTPLPTSNVVVPETVATCLSNTTDITISYSYRWDQLEWQRSTVAPQGKMRHWWTYSTAERSTAPTLQIAFDDNLADGATWTTRSLSLSRASSSFTCTEVANYSFLRETDSIGLASNSWRPGWPHPFAPSVVAGDSAGNWRPASGYRWYDPGNNDSLEVIEKDKGIIGLRISRERGVYPVVQSVVTGSAGAKAGVRAGMWIVSIDGVTTLRKSIDECAAMLAGRPGTLVRLEVRSIDRSGGRIELTRE